MPDLLLDTNAISAAMAGREELDQYLGRLKPETRLLTSVTVEGEIRFGLARIPSGNRKRRLTHALDKVLETLHEILPTTRDVAFRYATLKANLWGTGMPIDENDLWIAAAALTEKESISADIGMLSRRSSRRSASDTKLVRIDLLSHRAAHADATGRRRMRTRRTSRRPNAQCEGAAPSRQLPPAVRQSPEVPTPPATRPFVSA